MRKITLAVLISGMMILSGCIPASFNPIFHDDDIIYDEVLLGRWGEVEGEDKWVFTAHEEDAYRLAFYDVEDPGAGEFIVHLGKIGDNMFMDVYPDIEKMGINDFFMMHMAPLHSFYHVVQLEPNLIVVGMDYEWLEVYLSDNPDALEHMYVDERLIITAETDDIQAFLTEHLKTEGAFVEQRELAKE